MKFQVHTTSRSEIFKFKFAAGKNDPPLPGLIGLRMSYICMHTLAKFQLNPAMFFFLSFTTFPQGCAMKTLIVWEEM